MSQAKNPSQENRRSIPIWIQLIIWISLLGLLGLLASMLLKAKNPIIKVGSAVPNFTLPLFSGFEFHSASEIKLSELSGKVVVVNFWASWCDPCRVEAVDLENAWRHYGEDGEVVFLGVNYVDTEPEARAYLDDFSISYPNGPDMGTRISQLFNRQLGVPETYIIDQEGILRFIQIGPFQSQAEIQAVIDPLIAAR